MSDKDIYKECAATSTAALEEYITNPCIPKNENEWWASREITRLRAENEKFYKQAEMNARLLTENASLRAENETLRRDVKTAVMGDSAELQDVKRENEKLREALKPFAYNYQNNGLSHSMFIFEMKDLLAAKKALESGE